MADPVKTPSETPNQPVVETPAAGAAPAAAAIPANPPPTLAPTVETPSAGQPATPATAVTPGDASATGATEAQARALVEAAAARSAAEAASAAALAVPENYDLKIPEPLAAKGMKLDPDLLPALAPALKAARLTQLQLQTVADAFLTFQEAQPARMLAADLERTTKDPLIGGMKYGQTVKHVQLALDAFADPGFKQFVQAAGFGNRLEFVRVFERIGEAMARSGDTPNRGSPDGAPEMSRAERMYGRSKHT